MSRKIKYYLIVPFLLVIAAIIIAKIRPGIDTDGQVKEIAPSYGHIQTVISTTGTILPKNRLEIKPPVNGRIESILVKEGEKVKKGQTLAWMSSTERAALLDAAQGESEDKLKYWQETYKPIALLASIDGEVIVATTQPGQTVTTSDAVVVLSDQLIVRAQVDETDIGKIRLNMRALVKLDAYPGEKIRATVEHIYYESKTVNNVTIYEVDLMPEIVPFFFRSGMNASIDFIEQEKNKALLLPQEAILKENGGNYVLINQGNGKEPLKAPVTLGISDDKNIEVLSGASENDRITVRTKKYTLPTSTVGSNPFMPNRRR